jgi:LacI family transcriptional regulator
MQPKRPTSADVAALAGVSRTTVSFVLNGRDVAITPATRERVLDAARQLGYHPNAPARQLAGGQSHTVALVLRQTREQVAGDALLTETLRGLTIAARSRGFRVLVESFLPGDDGYAELVRTRRADGLVVSGPRTDDRHLADLAREGFPLVLQGSLPGLDVPSVDIDNVAGARLAVEHLLGLGHQRIGCITNDGYRAAMRGARIEPDAAWVIEAAFDAPSGRRAMRTLLERADLDAVFVASDVVAFGAMDAVRATGRRIPDDLSIVGFDDIPLAAFLEPSLTTVRLPAYELGHAAGIALLDRISRTRVPDRTLLPTDLVVRASSGPPRPSPSQRRGH